MASMRDIKRRKGSIQSTQQITKAMKLVSTVKLQRAKGRAENAKPYFDAVYQTISSILSLTTGIEHPYITGNGSDDIGIVVITSNRGLAGGYNSNIVRMVRDSGLDPQKTHVYNVGKKGRDGLRRGGFDIVEDYSEAIESPAFADAYKIGSDVLRDYTEGKIGCVYLAYTRFKNTVVHEPRLLKLLPVEIPDEATWDDPETEKKEIGPVMNFEPNEEEALELIVPKYLNSLIYGALIEAIASENGARMQAMDSATNNAEEMISKLSLQYNRARQGAITQELTEIIAGANAIS
ncbi:MAG: ATP synthase F1 subunit gamma [Lachnospiraceae bacterium]|nr:ATP synthase F1 subunit gamma [Lachnospiraceae bacterium]